MTHEEALRKVQSCLRLAKSSNPHEAALAAAKAQEIMDRHNITVAASELERGAAATPAEAIVNFNKEPTITACQKDKNWTIQLSLAVATANGCKTYFLNRNGGCACYLIGRPSDVAAARYIINLLALEIRRLAREHTKGYSEKYRRDFRYGAVMAIREKLEAQWEASKIKVKAENTGLALVRVSNAIKRVEDKLAEVDVWAAANMNFRQTKSKLRLDAEARAHGYELGQTIQISQAKGGIGEGAKALQ